MISDNEKESYRRVAEAIVGDVSQEARERLNNQAKVTIEALRTTVPDASDDTIIGFLSELSFMAATFRSLTVESLTAALENTFNNTALALASLAGVYDLGDSTTPVRSLEDLVKERNAEIRQRQEDLNKNTGLYL